MASARTRRPPNGRASINILQAWLCSVVVEASSVECCTSQEALPLALHLRLNHRHNNSLDHPIHLHHSEEVDHIVVDDLQEDITIQRAKRRYHIKFVNIFFFY